MLVNSRAVVCRARALSLVLMVLLFGVGCGGSTGQPKAVPASGTVLYKGEPVEGATVSFWAKKAPRAASGVSNARGEFSLSLFGVNDGAIAGENTITVSKAAPGTGATAASSAEAMLSDPTAMANAAAATGAGGPEAPKSLIPDKYGSLGTSTLKETVTEQGPNKFVLQLVD